MLRYWSILVECSSVLCVCTPLMFVLPFFHADGSSYLCYSSQFTAHLVWCMLGKLSELNSLIASRLYFRLRTSDAQSIRYQRILTCFRCSDFVLFLLFLRSVRLFNSECCFRFVITQVFMLSLLSSKSGWCFQNQARLTLTCSASSTVVWRLEARCSTFSCLLAKRSPSDLDHIKNLFIDIISNHACQSVNDIDQLLGVQSDTYATWMFKTFLWSVYNSLMS